MTKGGTQGEGKQGRLPGFEGMVVSFINIGHTEGESSWHKTEFAEYEFSSYMMNLKMFAGHPIGDAEKAIGHRWIQ